MYRTDGHATLELSTAPTLTHPHPAWRRRQARRPRARDLPDPWVPRFTSRLTAVRPPQQRLVFSVVLGLDRPPDTQR